MSSRKIDVGAITRDPALWPRGQLDEDRIQLFAGYIEAGDAALLPPIVVVRNGRGWLLADGWHRLAAAERCGVKAISADVADPPPARRLEDYVYELAVRTAVHAALPLTANERVAVIWRLIAERSDLSDRAIGRLTGCSHVTVGKYRRMAEGCDDGGGHFDRPAVIKPARPETPSPVRHLPRDAVSECRNAATNLVADMVRMVKYDHDHIAHDYLAQALALRFDQEQAGWWLAEMQRIFFRAEEHLPSARKALGG